MKAIVFLAAALLVSCCPRATVPTDGKDVPYHSSRAVVPANVREQFFGAIRRVAEEQAFAIRIAPTHPDGQHFIVQLWRTDVKAIFVNSADASVFTLGFFLNTQQEIPRAALDAVPTAFEEAMSHVPSVAISELK